ncbi:hypothetical protein LOTGIDRAFT_228465 [Lottia gigantea]|uniref:Caprin-1 dimerization domain-containing protein n=1 Tax=Lottia gigantea TaxID=225164 RepID=V4ASX1_LOTGI|nr:hypothetical protein LOTGIDRAFT_228465 [Lottia gigantea]ESO97970.1 hypothetical protein LOTGIDRAFT_228465 [Lottia gigantea]
MPAATEKPAKKPQNEPEDPLRQVLTVVDRKVSNLEKKKAKLEGLKQKLAHGDRLEAPQREAVARYDQVVHNLEFAQELQKQFEAISNEAERLQKKKLKKERMEKRVMEMRRVQELIELQSLLDSLGSDTVRSDLQTGNHGAVVFTEENLTQLDEFYQLICPTRESKDNYRDQTMAASVHLVNLLDSSHKEIVGSTYKQIKELLTLLNNCGYFEKSVEKNDSEKEKEEVPKEDDVESSTTSVEKDQEIETPVTTENIEYTDPVEPTFSDPVIESQPTVPPTLPVANQEMDNQYFNAPIEEPKNRPVQDIVTQGNFNFLQDSMLEFDSHSDPAIVAVLPNQPMTRPLSNQPDNQQPTYNNQPYNEQSHFDDGYNMTSDQNWANSTAFPTEDAMYQDGMIGNQQSTYPETLEQGNDLDDKKFTMNAKAPVFTSMYNQGGDNSDSQNNSHSYQGNNQNDGSYRGNSRGIYRDNYRGRNRGDSNQNGYGRGRGRGGYQGYQGRNNEYNRNDGYQGYQGRDYKSGGYQGRGGPRGGRGGPPRGGNARGGNRGGFGRPQN